MRHSHSLTRQSKRKPLLHAIQLVHSQQSTVDSQEPRTKSRLFEEVLADDETTAPTPHPKLRIAKTSGEQAIRIQASGGLSDAEIDKMVKEAEANADEDKKRRALVEAKNQAESLIHTTEKSIVEYGDKAEESEKEAISKAVTALREAVSSDDSEAITAKTQELMTLSMKLGEAMYKASAQESEAAEAEAAKADAKKHGAGDDVIDADFEEVDTKEKKKRA